jgi:hypothetical protein
MNEQFENNFKYHSPSDKKLHYYSEIRNHAKRMAYLIDERCPNSREKSLALTKLEECAMWANASIARNE